MAAYSPGAPAELDPTTGDSLATIARSVSAGSEVLELGPGPGTLTRHLNDVRGCRVDCVERSPEMAATARNWARELWEADLDQSDLAELTDNRTYDAVVTADVLEHLMDPARVLNQCRERLRPDGDLFVSLPNVAHAAVVAELLDGRFPYGDFGLLDRTHRWFFTRSSVLSLLRDAGFRVERLDRVTRMPELTEFHRRLDQLAPALRDELLHHADALTYQFVVRARVGQMTDQEWDSLETESSPAELRFRAKLYWAPVGEASSEELHVAAFGRLGADRQQLRFSLPDEPAIGALRFDPAEGPGFVRLYSIEVRAGGSTVLHLDNPGAIAQSTTPHEMTALSGPEGGFLMRTDDPFLQLPMPQPLAAAQEREVVIEMDWPASREYVLAQEHIDTLHLENEERTARHNSEMARLNDELARRRAESEAALAAANERITASQTEVDALRTHTSSLEQTLDEVLTSKGWRALEWLRAFKPGSS